MVMSRTFRRLGAKCPFVWLTYCLILGLLSLNLGASSLRTRHKHSLQSDFLITFANATVYLGCHLPQEQILWLHNGEQVSGIEYTVKEVKTNVIHGFVEETVKPTHGRRFRSEYLPQSGRHILAIQPVIATDIGTWTCHALQQDPHSNSNNDTSSTKTRHQHLRQKSAFVDRKHNERDSWSLIVLPSLEEPHVFNGEGEKRYASSSVRLMGPTPSLSRGLPSPPSKPAPSSKQTTNQGTDDEGPEDETAVITVQEGDELTLLCAMLVKLKNQREASLKWNSPFFDTSSQFSKEFFVQNNADLKALISVVTLSRIEREGNKQDVACQGVGNSDPLETALTVLVQYPPTFTISRTPRFGVPILSGMTVVLECFADVQPQMTGSWLKDEFPMESVNGSLIIDSVSSEDVGWYQCYINYNGEEYSSIGYFLNVKSPELPPQDSPREIQSALSQNMSEASFASLKTSESPSQDALDVVAKNVLYSERKNCSKALLSLMSEERYRQPRIHSLNNQSHWQLALDSSISLSFEVCANPKPSRLFWATPVFTLRPGQQSPDLNLVAHNVTRSKDNATCLVVTLEVKKLNRALMGEYILVATNQYGIEDGMILISQSHSGQTGILRSSNFGLIILVLLLNVKY